MLKIIKNKVVESIETDKQGIFLHYLILYVNPTL